MARLIAGRYELRRALSERGDTTIWEGRDTALGRRVLVELLRETAAADPARVEAYYAWTRERARAPTAPGQPRVLDAGEDEGTAFTVLEWLDDNEVQQPPPAPPAPAAEAPAARAAPPPTRTRAQPSAGSRGRSALPLLLVLVPAVIGVFVIGSFLMQDRPAGQQPFSLPAPATLDTSAPTPPAPQAAKPQATAPAATPAGAARATPSPAANSNRRTIINTDGQGVALRNAPNGERQPGRGYDEGATVTVLERRDGWARIRGDDGREGWILGVTVAP